MTDIEKIKYFLTSDESFLIDIDKISLITFKGYEGEKFLNDAGTPIKYENTDQEIYKSSKDILSSYYNVYIDGVASPVQLKYTDGVMLLNIVNLQSSIFFNSSYNGIPIDMPETQEINDIKYTIEKYIVPNKLVSTKTSIDGLNSTTRLTIKNT